MEKTVLLKTQLHEASKLGQLNAFKFQRLSVILLDNFIEIQLRCLMDDRLYCDGLWGISEKKYKQKQRRKINDYYEELLKACVKESIINEGEKKLLLFCHDIRNNLYHKIHEEELLVIVAIIILHKIITEKQPGWGNGLGVTLSKEKKFDPFVNKRSKDSAFFNSNTKDEWNYFLKKYFNFIDKRSKSIPCLLKENIELKVKQTKSNLKFINKDFGAYFPHAKNWGFNEFCLYYSFHNILKNKIEEITEDKSHNAEEKYKNLFIEYKKKWKKVYRGRLKVIEKHAKSLNKLPLVKSLEKYISIKTEMNLIYDVFDSASRDLDREIQSQIDIARGK